MNRIRFSCWLALGLVTITATSLTACTSGSSAKLGGKPLNLRHVVDATKALGKVDTTGEIRNGNKRGSVVGAYDYAATLANLSIPVLAPTGTPRAGYLVKGKEAWIDRPAYTGLLPRDPYASPLLRRPGTKSWLSTGPNLAYVVAILGGYDPVMLGTFLRYAEVTMLRVGSESLHGRAVEHYRASLTATKPTVFHLRAVDLWVNARKQLVRVKLLTTAKNVVTYDVRPRITGVEVTPPPPNEIENSGAPTPIGPALTGPYTQVGSGTANGISFTIERAPATNGVACWRVQSTPAFVASATDREDGARCVATPTASDPTDQVLFPIDSGAGSPYELLGALLPEGATATLTMTDGSTRPFTRGDAGVAIYAGGPEPGPAFLAVSLPTGEKLACGPGPISALTDVEGSSAPDLAPQPWSCLVP